MKKKRIALIFSAIAAILLACGESGKQEEISEDPVESTESEAALEMPSESSFEFDLIIANNIAAPVKLLTDMNEAGLNHYRADVTNSVDNLDKYQTSEQKAISFGVYGADLSYNSLYGHHEEMADYLIVIHKLSDDLGLTSLFDQNSFESFERIKTNPDSVKMFIFSKYDEADEYLRSNDRLVTACMVLTGGLIESLHLVSSQIETGDTNKEAYKIFLSQKHTLESLISLYGKLESEGHEISFKADVEMLHNKFVELDSFDKFSKGNIQELHESIREVRNKLV